METKDLVPIMWIQNIISRAWRKSEVNIHIGVALNSLKWQLFLATSNLQTETQTNNANKYGTGSICNRSQWKTGKSIDPSILT